MDAITDPLCIEPPNQGCDVCSLVFFPTWVHFMPGNFWTSRCEYVNKLLHPVKFASEKAKLDKYFQPLQDEGLMLAIIFDDREDTKGLGRYAAGTSFMVQEHFGITWKVVCHNGELTSFNRFAFVLALLLLPQSTG